VHQLTSIEDLRPAPWNPREISPEALAGLKVSMEEFGDISGIVWNARTGHLVAGHQRLAALQEKYGEGLRYEDGAVVAPDGERFPIRVVDWDELKEKAANVAANSPEIQGTFTDDLGSLLAQLQIDMPELSIDLRMAELAMAELGPLGLPADEGEEALSLAARFGVPPFTILDARQGYWQERKAAWLALGIDSAATREGLKTSGSLSGTVPRYYQMKEETEARLGRELTHQEFQADHLPALIEGTSLASSDTGGIVSIFDPVVCELVYRWFCPPGGSVLDPFAGGSVRGVVAAWLGRDYTGVDLSERQVKENRRQAINTVPERQPKWIHGDSLSIDELAPGDYDLVFSCPPYADLKVYSDDARDLSNMNYTDFLEAYREIIARSVAMLRDDRFACFVVGEVRGEDGAYRSFVPDTIAAFEDAGARFYNEAILVTMVGSLPIRVRRAFEQYRKLGKCHQNVLVFLKGDARAVTPLPDEERGAVADIIEGGRQAEGNG